MGSEDQPAAAVSAADDGRTAEIAQRADDWVRAVAQARGVQLDFTPASLHRLDELLEQHHQQYATDGALPEDGTVEGATDHLQEVARRTYGGEYVDDEQPGVALLHIDRGASGVLVFGREKVVGRIEHGAEDSLPFFFDGIEEGLQREGLTLLH